MIVSIGNELLRVRVNTLGAELVGVSSTLGYEYIHQPSLSWIGQAKNLFPNVALVKDGYANIRGEKYPFKQHGFAKDMEFSLVSQTHDSIKLRLESDFRVLEFIPYKFTLDISFTLKGRSLFQTYDVLSRDAEDIYFGIGAHTGFSLTGESSYISFHSEDFPMELMRPDMGYLNGEKKPFFLNKENAFVLNEHSFAFGAHILCGIDSTCVVLHDGKHSIEVSFPGFPFLTLWSMPGKPEFVCIEPWCGLPDYQDTSHIFEDKPGNNCLASGERFSVTQCFTLC